jgi:hypothetical protein
VARKKPEQVDGTSGKSYDGEESAKPVSLEKKHIPKITKLCPECALINNAGNAAYVPVHHRAKPKAKPEIEDEDGKEESDEG